MHRDKIRDAGMMILRFGHEGEDTGPRRTHGLFIRGNKPAITARMPFPA